MKHIAISMSDPSIQYEIDDQAFTCSCPAFQKGITRPCKHMKEAGIVPKLDETAGHQYMKSTIQKAYRRNDQKLLRWAFDYLWDNEQSWLYWRALVLAAEDHWQGCIELGRSIRTSKEILKATPMEAKEVLWEGLSTTASEVKNQDSNGLRQVARTIYTSDDRDKMLVAVAKKVKQPEFHMLQRMIEYTDIMLGGKKKQIPKEVWTAIWMRVESFEPTHDPKYYQDLRDGVGALYFRSKQGGGPDYQLLFLAGVELFLLFAERGWAIIPEESDEALTGPWIKNHILPPWYCIDMHTGVGRRVLGYLSKVYSNKYANGEKVTSMMEELWFVKETALVNETCPLSIWWELNFRLYMLNEGFNPDVVATQWEKEFAALAEQKVKDWV